MFVAGHQFYPSARFPSLDFSVVHALDRNGTPANEWIEKRGDAVPPARVLPSDVKWGLAEGIPQSLDILPGSVERLEEAVRRRTP